MQQAIYLDDSYIREWKAAVKKVDREKFITLDRTAFYPKGGGVPHDTGTVRRISDGMEFRVVFSGKFSGEISHETDKPGLLEGDQVECSLDWERRYKLMRLHTACHILSSIFFRQANALVTGNQIETEKTRIDYDMADFSEDKVREYIADANDIFSRNIGVKIYYMDREKALEIPEIVKLKNAFPPSIPKLRIVEVPGIDIQADGGPHVANTGEIGSIRLAGTENKGRQNRRIYITLAD